METDLSAWFLKPPLATTSTAVTTPWIGTSTWNGNPAWTGSRTWNGSPTWAGNTQIWNGDKSFNRPFYYPPSYNPLQGQTVYCYPMNQPMYRSFLPVPYGPVQEIGSVTGGYWDSLMKKK
ncbi:hypothetical protein KP79_PYT07164 [Mizuhopecten yessoensis]|uniref:Uncharacterized protein n=1 Tax=Mizuhopecten yessoensis TaxID=6573 RepID=A0A210PRP9_MIZYE|nr:hypothetical protein KP79_PYT07164 [Mizuhopecten yessoensis]